MNKQILRGSHLSHQFITRNYIWRFKNKSNHYFSVTPNIGIEDHKIAKWENKAVQMNEFVSNLQNPRFLQTARSISRHFIRILNLGNIFCPLTAHPNLETNVHTKK